MPTPYTPPSAVQRVLKRVGRDIRQARKLRKLPMEVVANRAHTSRKTLQRVESGDFRVNIGIYTSVLLALDLLDNFEEIASLSNDPTGQKILSIQLLRKSK